MRDIAGNRLIVFMTLLAGSASFFIGGAYQAQMPNFATDLGYGDPGIAYSMLLAADAAGALLAGFVLEGSALLKAHPRTALLLALTRCVSLIGFASARRYPLALALLFVAGFLELSFSSTTQALVQLNAPGEIRGRVIGLFNMAALGMRAFSSITVGLMGALIGVHWSLALSAVALMAMIGALLARFMSKPAVA